MQYIMINRLTALIFILNYDAYWKAINIIFIDI